MGSTTLPASAAGSASASPLPLNRKKYAPAPMASTATSAMTSSFFLPPFGASSSAGASSFFFLLTSPPRWRSSNAFAVLLCPSARSRARSRVASLGSGGALVAVGGRAGAAAGGRLGGGRLRGSRLRGGLETGQQRVGLGGGRGQDDDVDPPVDGHVVGVGVRYQRPGAPV